MTLLLVALEVGLRVFGIALPHTKYYAMPDEELSWVNKPGSDVEVVGLDYRYGVRINSLGLRGEELEPDPSFRILAIGDSKTFCQGVEDHETWPALLEERLAKDLPGTEVVNAGVYGYGALQTKGHLVRVWDAVRPNVVVYMHSGNDFSDDLRYSRGHYDEIRRWIPGRRFLRDHSALYAFASKRALSVLAAMGIWKPGVRFEEGGEGGAVSDLADEWREGRDLTCETMRRSRITFEPVGPSSS